MVTANQPLPPTINDQQRRRLWQQARSLAQSEKDTTQPEAIPLPYQVAQQQPLTRQTPERGAPMATSSNSGLVGGNEELFTPSPDNTQQNIASNNDTGSQSINNNSSNQISQTSTHKDERAIRRRFSASRGNPNTTNQPVDQTIDQTLGTETVDGMSGNKLNHTNKNNSEKKDAPAKKSDAEQLQKNGEEKTNAQDTKLKNTISDTAKKALGGTELSQRTAQYRRLKNTINLIKLASAGGASIGDVLVSAGTFILVAHAEWFYSSWINPNYKIAWWEKAIVIAVDVIIISQIIIQLTLIGTIAYIYTHPSETIGAVISAVAKQIKCSITNC